jgi:hypothetical protein
MSRRTGEHPGVASTAHPDGPRWTPVTVSDNEAVALAQRMLEVGSIYTFGAYRDAGELAEWVASLAGMEGERARLPRLPLHIESERICSRHDEPMRPIARYGEFSAVPTGCWRCETCFKEKLAELEGLAEP